VIDPAAILAYDFGETTQEYVARDAILYALGLGLGADPLNAADLRFLDERDLAVLPTFAVTLCSPGMWIRKPALGVNFGKLVHYAQWAEFPNSLPPATSVTGTARIAALTDRGEGRGAVLVLERTLVDPLDGKVFCRLRQSLLLRGDGGFGGEPAQRERKFAPDGEPDATVTIATSPRAALIYRLSGDWNPLHLDPKIAAAAGFQRPILHGLGSYGMAGVAVSHAMGHDPASISSLACRFAGVVMPGDQIAFHVWNDGGYVSRFSAFVGDRKVLDDGEITWRNM
jgi:acyl dehydratase